MGAVSRRRFYAAIIYGLGFVISAALAIPAGLYILVPPRLRRKREWVDAGDISKLEPDAPAEMIFDQIRTDGWTSSIQKKTAWVVKIPGQGVVAFGPQCTHLGCAYHWEEGRKQFLCPCHTSVFAIDGKVVSGPAPRPLDRYETKVEKNRLLLGNLTESA
jgi:quinol---cytochrome c reductase iron-sulfur subunit, bacillus type